MNSHPGEMPLLKRSPLLRKNPMIFPGQRAVLLFAMLFLSGPSSWASIELDEFLSSNMVLQQDREVKISGTAEKRARIRLEVPSLSFREETRINRDGSWEFRLKPLKPGNPFGLSLTELVGRKTNSAVHLTNIVVGEVWIICGQSERSSLERERPDGAVRKMFELKCRYLVRSGMTRGTTKAEWKTCAAERFYIDLSRQAYYLAQVLSSQGQTGCFGIIQMAERPPLRRVGLITHSPVQEPVSNALHLEQVYYVSLLAQFTQEMLNLKRLGEAPAGLEKPAPSIFPLRFVSEERYPSLPESRYILSNQ